MSDHDSRVRIEYAIQTELECDHQDWCHMAVGCCPRCVCDLPGRIAKAVTYASNMEAIQHEMEHPMVFGKPDQGRHLCRYCRGDEDVEASAYRAKDRKEVRELRRCHEGPWWRRMLDSVAARIRGSE